MVLKHSFVRIKVIISLFFDVVFINQN